MIKNIENAYTDYVSCIAKYLEEHNCRLINLNTSNASGANSSSNSNLRCYSVYYSSTFTVYGVDKMEIEDIFNAIDRMINIYKISYETAMGYNNPKETLTGKNGMIMLDKNNKEHSEWWNEDYRY